MECDICSRSTSPKVPFHCATCARNHTYGLRLEVAKTLLEKETKSRQVEEVTATGSAAYDKKQGDDPDRSTGTVLIWACERAAAAKEQSEHRAAAMSEHSKALQKEIGNMREDIRRRKLLLAQRRSETESVTHQVVERRSTMFEGVEHSVKRKEQSWYSLHNKISESRAFLCREAAKLHGLKQRKKKRGEQVRDEYSIGGVGVVDLTEMNSK